MKIYPFILASVLFMATSCTKDDIPSADEINNDNITSIGQEKQEKSIHTELTSRGPNLAVVGFESMITEIKYCSAENYYVLTLSSGSSYTFRGKPDFMTNQDIQTPSYPVIEGCKSLSEVISPIINTRSKLRVN